MGFGLAVMHIQLSCSKEDEVRVESVKTTKWYSSGVDVAPLFRAFPLLIDSIYLELTEHIPLKLDTIDGEYVKRYYLYIEQYKQNQTEPEVISGNSSYGAEFKKQKNDINDIIAFWTKDATKQIAGIYEKHLQKTIPEMRMEYVYNTWEDILPPTAEGGFGSTAEGGYGDNNIHKFIKILPEEENDE